MTEPMNIWDDFMKDQVARTAVDLLELPQLGRSSSSPSSPTNVVDANAVAEQVFGSRIDLAKRGDLIALLTRTIPVKDGTGAIAVKPETSATMRSNDAIGPYAATQLAAQTLLANSDLLTAIKPLSDCNRKTDCCDFQTLVPLIQESISALVRELGTPDVPFAAGIEILLRNLAGYDHTPPDFGAGDIKGYFGKLRDRCGLDPRNVCSLSDEKVMTAFSSLVALTRTVVQRWHDAQDPNGPTFIALSVFPLRRNLLALVAGLGRLRDLVSPAAWLTSELNTTPPMTAGKLYQWIYQYASTQALQTLRAGGRDGLCAIAETMKEFAVLLQAGFLSPDDSPGDDEATTSLDQYCQRIPRAFDTHKVKKVVEEMLCHIHRILELARTMACQPATSTNEAAPTSTTAS